MSQSIHGTFLKKILCPLFCTNFYLEWPRAWIATGKGDDPVKRNYFHWVKSIYLLGAQCWPSLKSLAHAYSFFFKYMLHTVPFCRHSNTLKSLIPAHFTIDPVIKYRFLTMIFPFHFSDTTTPGQHCSRSK